MKIMLKIWILFGVLATVAISQTTYDSDHLIQEPHYDSEEKTYYPSNRRYQHSRSYEPTSHEDESSSDPRHYQSLEPKYTKHEQEPGYQKHEQEPGYYKHEQEPGYYKHEPETEYHKHEPERGYYKQEQEAGYHKRETEPYVRAPQYHALPQQIRYHQPEDPAYHRPQEIVYRQVPQHYQEEVPEHQESYEGSTHHLQPEEKEDPKYAPEEPKYVQSARPSHSSHPAPVPTDPKLPLYFTMYEKRVIQDPLDKFGKGPWRYLTYGHGITYGSKEPGKVFEKGYGYIRALGRDHCKLPEHLCPPKDDKPFDYEGRKEPYFGYRPH